MSSAEVAESGRALFGDRWQTPLARALKVSDRTLRRWLADQAVVPVGVEGEIQALLRVQWHILCRLAGSTEQRTFAEGVEATQSAFAQRVSAQWSWITSGRKAP
jgi:hypothetical protein